jgi:hypothetical protein
MGVSGNDGAFLYWRGGKAAFPGINNSGTVGTYGGGGSGDNGTGAGDPGGPGIIIFKAYS